MEDLQQEQQQEQVFDGEQYCALKSYDKRRQFVIKQLFGDKKMPQWQWERELFNAKVIDSVSQI